MSDSKITVELRAKIDDLEKKLKKAESDVKKFEKGTSNATEKAENSFKSLGSVIGGAIALDSVIGLTKAMVDITAKFEKYNAVLTNSLGSQEAASASLKQLQSFAAETPFSVDELTASYIKLVNQGFLPTKKQLTQLGDLASSTGKSFDQLTEAILDAQQGEFERLKEFGIRAQDNGNTIIFTFKGIQTEVDKTSSSIRDYITALGDAEGVSGSMEAISKTLTGQLSNLGDSWDAVLVSFGNRTSGVFKTAIDQLNKFLQRVAEINTNLENTEKVGAKQSFGDRFKGLLSTFSLPAYLLNRSKPSQEDLIGGTVTAYREEFEALAADFTKNAKKSSDFTTAIKQLNAEFDKYAGRVKASPVLFKAYELARDNAIALIEAQKKAFEQAQAGNGNFGKSGKGKTGFAKLAADLQALEDQLENSIVAGTTKAGDVDSPLVRRVVAANEALTEFKKTFDALKSGNRGLDPLSAMSTTNIPGSTGLAGGDQDALIQRMKNTSEQISLTNQQAAAQWAANDAMTKETEIIYELQNTIGTGLTNAFESMITGTQSAVQAVGGFLKQLVARIIAATAAAAALAAILALTGFGPGFGAAASSLGSFKNLFNGLSGITAFAKGGIITGPTLALMGEAGESEVVAPLSKFNEMVNERASNNTPIIMDVEISGEKLYLVQKRYEKNYKRTS